MKKLIVLLFLSSLAGCANIGSTRPSVEAEDIGPTTNRAVSAIKDCLDYDIEKKCVEAETLFDKHGWLIDRQVNITNSDGMRQNEWEIGVRTSKKNLDTIQNRYTDFLLRQ